MESRSADIQRLHRLIRPHTYLVQTQDWVNQVNYSSACLKEVGLRLPLQTAEAADTSARSRVNNEGDGTYIYDERARSAYNIHHLCSQRYPKRIVILNQYISAECAEQSMEVKSLGC